MISNAGSRDLSLLVEPIARARKSDRVTELAAALAELARRGALTDPALFAAPRRDRYARRLIWRDPSLQYVVVGMTWAPGQRSPLHDHAGLFGTEIVVTGVMTERPFHLVEKDADGRYLFLAEPQTVHRPGSISTLVPPLEYHEFANAGEGVAHTVHVYSGELRRCTIFEPHESGWWRRRTVELDYDA